MLVLIFLFSIKKVLKSMENAFIKCVGTLFEKHGFRRFREKVSDNLIML